MRNVKLALREALVEDGDLARDEIEMELCEYVAQGRNGDETVGNTCLQHTDTTHQCSTAI